MPPTTASHPTSPPAAAPTATAAGRRTRRDLCPGVLRPWPADDGALVRIRLVGGRITSTALRALSAIAHTHGDGDLHLTGRANVQLRGLVPGAVPVEAFEAAGVLPSRSHELVRNLMVSPQSGLPGGGGRADLRPVADELDRLVVADPDLAALPGRFVHVLDDGRGDLLDRPLDLGLVALDADHAQLRVGSQGWGPVVALTAAPAALVDLARRFLAARGTGTDAAWHVDELPEPLVASTTRDPRTHVRTEPASYGAVGGGVHVQAPGGVLSRDLVDDLTAIERTLVVTPWRGVLVPA